MPNSQPEPLPLSGVDAPSTRTPINRRQMHVNPAVLRWALERSRKDLKTNPPPKDIRDKVPLWLTGEASPSYAQLRVFARYTYVGLSRLLELEPPKETLPIADFRTKRNVVQTQHSGELLDTLFYCQLRQLWYHDYSIDAGISLPEFPGLVRRGSSVTRAAQTIRGYINWSSDDILDDRKNRWEGAVASFRKRIEDAGVLVMFNTCVGTNPNRKLDPDEFRGFSLTYGHFPLIFVNKRDATSAQMFSLGHELAHVFSDTPGLSRTSYRDLRHSRSLEAWCNAVAAELLVPADKLKADISARVTDKTEVRKLAYRFAVSRLVILYRLRDLGLIDSRSFADLEQQELAGASTASGGRSTTADRIVGRLGHRFCHAVVSSTIAGETLEDEAFDLLDIRSEASFAGLVTKLDLA